MSSSPKSVVLLGSTGSIGTQAIEVIDLNPDRFTVTALAAGGSNLDLLAAQAAHLGVHTVAITNPAQAIELGERLRAAGSSAQVLAGPDSATEVAVSGADLVLNGITGSVPPWPRSRLVRPSRWRIRNPWWSAGSSSRPL